jgi:Flp pilus assembly protein TadG
VHRFLVGARAGAVALLFAIMAIPIIGLIGLALDYGIWNETYAALALAANAAALNAAKTAASADLKNDPNFLAEGVTSGQQWFLADLDATSLAASVKTSTPIVAVTMSGVSITANVTFNATVSPIFGRLFHFGGYPISLAAAASMPVTSYLEVILMLDNSASMAIGAGNADMQTLMQQSPCDPANEYYRTAGNSTYTQLYPNNYGIYQYSWNGVNYDGALATPITSGGITYKPTNYKGGAGYSVAYCNATQVTNGYCQQQQTCPNVNGYTAYAGPPCAFACHADSSKTAGLGTDLWAMARRNNVTLRFDLLKNATNLVLQTMATDDVDSLNNLSVGIYTFNTIVTPIYPGGNTCTTNNLNTTEACTDFTAAENAVGAPPAHGSGIYTDTGIQPGVALATGNNDNTAFTESMSTLAGTYLSAAGDGTSAAKPRKVLFLITDGFEDDPNTGARVAMPSSACQTFKSMGYTVYVVYTPYYPVMHEWYLQNAVSIVEGSGAASITYNLQACASATGDYISAADQTTLNAALLTFLKNALSAPVSFTK